ncbi:MAG TPA: alcohol dehydrogenase catalytic domain-containing protein [Spirochaetia bacterium]|nr:alcohol dehydrogenase catalytic domain-containing protein [Spirochaetia bacterium]
MDDRIPEKMEALVLTSPSEFSIQLVPVPKAAAGEVLCRIRAVAICGSDPEIIRGDLAGYWPPSYPFIAGHEWSGEVVAVGEGVTSLAVGDRVAGQAHKGCGYCTRCLEGRYNICENYARWESGHRHYGFINQGAYAQYNAYSVKALTKVPDSVSFREGALVDTSGVVSHGMELTGITAGGTVAVIGPGPIGLITMRMAKILGASRVIAIGRRSRLEAAARLCADAAVDFEKEDPVKAVRALTGELGVDESFECSGAKGTVGQAVRMVKRGGRVGLLGVPQGEVEEEIPFRYFVSNEIAMFGSKANPNVSHKIVALLASGQLVLKDLISHVFPLTEFKDALDTFVSRKDGALKVVVEPNGSD